MLWRTQPIRPCGDAWADVDRIQTRVRKLAAVATHGWPTERCFTVARQRLRRLHETSLHVRFVVFAVDGAGDWTGYDAGAMTATVCNRRSAHRFAARLSLAGWL